MDKLSSAKTDSGSCNDQQINIDVDDEHDEVLEEYDIVLHNGSEGQILNMQYPLRPCDMPIDQPLLSDKQVQTRFRPKHNIFELNAPLRTDSASYSKEKGAQIAENCRAGVSSDAAGGSSAPPFGKLMNMQSIVGTAATGRFDGSYAIGLVHDGKIFLSPVNQMIEMRTTFSYLNVKGKGKTGNDADSGDSAGSGSESEAAPAAGSQAVRVKFARTETAWVKKRRETSAAHRQKLVEQDPWVQLDRHSVTNEHSAAERQSLVRRQAGEGAAAASDDSPSAPSAADLSRLLRLLVPEAVEETITVQRPPRKNTAVIKSELPLFHQIMCMLLDDRIQQFITKAQVATFDEVMSELALTDANEAVESLEKCAMLVNGCWTVKSDILYPAAGDKDRKAKSWSCESGVSGDALNRAMNFMLYHFHLASPLTKRELLDAVSLPAIDLDALLHAFGAYDAHTRVWRFALDTDQRFLSTYPECVERQRALWEAKWTELQLKLQQQAAHAAAAASRHRKRSTPSTSGSGARQRRLSARASPPPPPHHVPTVSSSAAPGSQVSHAAHPPMVSSAAPMSNGALLAAVVDGVATAGGAAAQVDVGALTVGNRQQTTTVVNGVSSPAAGASGGSPKTASRQRSASGQEDKRKKKIKDEPPATALPDTSVASSSDAAPSTELTANVRQFVSAALQDRKVASLSELRKQYRVRVAESPRTPAHETLLEDERTLDELITRVASQLDVTLIPGRKSSADPTFVWNGGSSWPELRTSLVRFLKEKTRGGFRVPTFKQFFSRDAGGDAAAATPDDAELKRILLEYCDLKSGIYSLRTNS